MAISSKELAQKLNLSPSAVSMALNNKPGVSEHTRQLVLAAAKQYGCTIPKQPDSTYTGTILFLIYKKHGEVVTDSPFFAELTEGITSGCRRGCYELKISYFYENQDHATQLNALRETKCSGIILLGTEMEQSAFQQFSALAIPMVVLDTYFEELTCDCVLINNVQGAFLATDSLIRHHIQTVGYLHSSYPIGNFSERADGYYKALRAHNISTDRPYVHRLTPSVEGAYSDMKKLLSEGLKTAKGYFADNDLIAAGAMRAFLEAGYRIPEDISIIGFDDMPICEYITPSLSTMAVPKHFLGELAVERLISGLQNPIPTAIKTEISPSLVLRNSMIS